MKSLDVVALFLEVNKNVLLCKRSKEKLYSIPGGKVESHESLERALMREIKEEIGLELCESRLFAMGKLTIYDHDPVYDFHLYSYTLDKKPQIKLNNEHTDYLWCNPNNIKVDLMPRFDQALNIYRNHHDN
jgi:ADP-ribose pyrophosphatase YjhB (NUDIX family)